MSDYLISVSVTQEGIEARAAELGRYKEIFKRFDQQIQASRGTVRLVRGNDAVQRAVDRQSDLVKRASRVVAEELEKVSLQTQADVATRLKKDIKHPTAATGALEAFTRSRQNRTSNARGFGVGNIEAMESDSKVRYALAIEAGSSASVGRRLVGYWDGAGGVTGFGARRDGQYFVKTSAEAAKLALKLAGRGKESVGGVVQRPIEPHRDYRKTAIYFKPQVKVAAALRKAYGFS